MPGATPNRGYPYPLGADPINIAGDIQSLASALDADVAEVDQSGIRIYPNFASLPTPGEFPGALAQAPAGVVWRWNGTAWVLFDRFDQDGPSTQGPYVGAWPPTTDPITSRGGHVSVTTTGFGDASVAFVEPFPSGVISIVITPVQLSKDAFWWPVIGGVNLNGFSVFAVTTQGSPAATGHPPSLPAVWTVVGTISFDYWAIGV